MVADREEEAFACEPASLSPCSLTRVSPVTHTKEQGHLLTQVTAELLDAVQDALGALKTRGQQASQQKSNLRTTHHLGIILVQEVTSVCVTCEIPSGEIEKKPQSGLTVQLLVLHQ